MWKIWDPIDKKIRETTSVSIDETFSKKSSEEFLKSLADYSNQELDIKTGTNSDSDDPEPSSRIQQPISYLTSPLSFPPLLFLWPRSPTLLHLPQFAQRKLDRQN